MAVHQSEGIVLRTYNLTDGDKVAVVFTKNHGVVRGYAHGARKLKSKFGSSLEPLTVAVFNFKQKENYDNVRFDGAEIKQSFFNISTNGNLLDTTTYWCELLMEFLPPHLPDERVYRMLKACLLALADNPSNINTGQLSCYFETWLLKLTGFLPDFKYCRQCGTNLSAETVSDVRVDGVICIKCLNGTDRKSNVYTLLMKIGKYQPSEFSLFKADAVQLNALLELIRSIICNAIEVNFLKHLKSRR